MNRKWRMKNSFGFRGSTFEELASDWLARHRQIFLENTAVKLYVEGSFRSPRPSWAAVVSNEFGILTSTHPVPLP